MKRNLARLLLGGLLAAVAVVLPAAPALAVDRNCYSNNYCIYRDSDFSTNNAMYRYTENDSNWCDYQEQICNADSSWRNYRSTRVWTYHEYSWSWIGFCLSSGYQINYNWWNNDEGESHRFDTGIASC
jgi:hypothetical protein